MTVPRRPHQTAFPYRSKEVVDQLVKAALGWSAAPERFLKGDRSWIPRWRFRPFERIEDAFYILDRVTPDEFSIIGLKGRPLSVRVRLGEKVGEARGTSGPATITWAVAKALGLGGEQ